MFPRNFERAIQFSGSGDDRASCDTMLAVSVNSTHCFSAAVDAAADAAAAAVAAVFESCPSERASERGGESARAALGERTLAARGAVDRTDGRTD